MKLTLFYPCHKNKNNNPSSKSISGECTKRLKFDAYTTQGLLAEFRGLWVQVIRRTRTTTKFWDPKFFQTQIFLGPNFSDPNFIQAQIFVGPKIFVTQNFFGTQNFSDPKFFWPKMNFNENDLRGDKTELLILRLSKLPSAKVLLKLEVDTEDQVLLAICLSKPVEQGV